MSSMLNPQFAEQNFIPDSEKEYICFQNISSSGFSYIHALVLGGETRIDELREYSELEIFREECDRKLTNGWTALSLVVLDKNIDTLRILFPFYTLKEIIQISGSVLEDFDIITKITLMTAISTDIMIIQNKLLKKQKKEIIEMKNRLSDRETFKQAISELGMTAGEGVIMSYL